VISRLYLALVALINLILLLVGPGKVLLCLSKPEYLVCL
jgi:hypothetical protein